MDSWNSFMQTRQARIVTYSICVAFCFYYVLDAVMELLDPERSAALIETLGETTFYLMDGGRALACLVTGIAFGRMLLKVIEEREE